MSPRRGPSFSSSRQSILDAALELFCSAGYEETTIEDVRRASGASTGSIYHHFKSKQALATALYVEGVAAYQQSFLEILAAHPDAEDGVRATVRHYLEWTIANPKLARFMLALPEGERREIATTRQDLSWRLVAETAAWRRRHYVTGALRVMADDVYRALVIGPAEAYARRWLAGLATTSPAEAIEQLADAAWRTVRQPLPRVATAPPPTVTIGATPVSVNDEATKVAEASWDAARLNTEGF